MSTGVNQGRQGTLAYWLVHMLSFVTGNLDEQGGNVFAPGFYDMASKGRGDFAATLFDGEFGAMRTGEIPGGLLSSYILDAENPVRVLFVIAGNPLLSLPGQALLEKAFAQLELFVVIDVYPNATSELADWLLPATDQFERSDLGVSGNSMQFDSWLQFTENVAEPQHERREEWWIFSRLAQLLGVKSDARRSRPDRGAVVADRPHVERERDHPPRTVGEPPWPTARQIDRVRHLLRREDPNVRRPCRLLSRGICAGDRALCATLRGAGGVARRADVPDQST